MAIDLNMAPMPTKPSAAPEGVQNRGKPANAESEGADAASFTSALAAASDKHAAADVDAPPAQAAEAKTADADQAQAAAGTDDKKPKDETKSMEPAEPAVDPTLLCAQYLQMLQVGKGVESREGALSGKQGQTTVSELKGVDKAPVSLVELAGAKPELPDAQAVGAGVPQEGVKKPGVAGGAVLEQMQIQSNATEQARAQALPEQALQALKPQQKGVPQIELPPQQALQNEKMEQSQLQERWMKSGRADEAQAAIPSVQLQIESTQEEGGLRRLERQAEKLAVRQGGEGAWGHQALVTGARGDYSAAAATVGGSAPAAAVAEQVRYWISNDVQKAELKLDGFGKHPVEVSIALNGLEARVVFRSDQPEIRQVLESSAGHLRDLLRNEGLVLSGVSVGSSGAQAQSDAQSRGGQQGPSRRATVLTELPAVAAPAMPRARPGASAGLDLFV